MLCEIISPKLKKLNMKTRLCVAVVSLLVACGNESDEQLSPSVESISSSLLNTTKTCSIDSNHWATVTSDVSGSTMVGYWITYHTNGGWRLGANNNEHVTANGSHWWDSADHCSPNAKCHRDMRNHSTGGITIQAVFDKDGGDPSCKVGF